MCVAGRSSIFAGAAELVVGDCQRVVQVRAPPPTSTRASPPPARTSRPCASRLCASPRSCRTWASLTSTSCTRTTMLDDGALQSGRGESSRYVARYRLTWLYLLPVSGVRSASSSCPSGMGGQDAVRRQGDVSCMAGLVRRWSVGGRSRSEQRVHGFRLTVLWSANEARKRLVNEG